MDIIQSGRRGRGLGQGGGGGGEGGGGVGGIGSRWVNGGADQKSEYEAFSAALRTPVLSSPIYRAFSLTAGEYSYALSTLALVEWWRSPGRKQAHC